MMESATLPNAELADSMYTVNIADDMSTVDADESALDRIGGPRRRRHDDEDDEPESFDEDDDDDDDDDLESVTSAAVDGTAKASAPKAEEEKELPPHACG